jgi:hypothetical protein
MNNGEIPPEILEWYHDHNEHVVRNDLSESSAMQIKEDDLIEKTGYTKNNSDELTRSILRHDSNKLAKVLSQYIV